MIKHLTAFLITLLLQTVGVFPLPIQKQEPAQTEAKRTWDTCLSSANLRGSTCDIVTVSKLESCKVFQEWGYFPIKLNYHIRISTHWAYFLFQVHLFLCFTLLFEPWQAMNCFIVGICPCSNMQITEVRHRTQCNCILEYCSQHCCRLLSFCSCIFMYNKIKRP